jgi:PAS domain S-box-containing protein
MQNKRDKFEKLHKKAGRIIGTCSDCSNVSGDGEIAKLLEELQIHQTELQLENEELRQMSNRLEESQAQYAELYNSAPVGYVTLNEQGVIIRANETAGNLVGLSGLQMKGKGFSQFIELPDHFKYFDLFKQFIGRKASRYSIELAMLRGDATSFPAEMTIGAPIYEEDRLMGWRIVFWDITDRKQAEKALKESEERYLSIFQAAKDAIIITNADTGRILDVNEYACKLYGYSYEEMLLLQFVELSAEENETRLALVSEFNWIPVRYHKRKDGTLFPVEISASYITHAQRRLATSVIRDITVRLEKDHALEQSEELLRYLSARLLTIQEEERQELAKELHDEVAIPLSSIKNYAQELFGRPQQTEGDPARRDWFKRMIGIIQDSMRASQRMMTSLRPPVLDDFGIVTTLKWLCRQLSTGYEEVQIDIDIGVRESEVPHNLKSILFRIAREALDNAVRHSHAKHIEIAMSSIEGSLQLKIKDDGIGFEHEATDMFGKGFGILSMKERTELTGGFFSIESVIGRGTTVVATWPVHPLSAGPAGRPRR